MTQYDGCTKCNKWCQRIPAINIWNRPARSAGIELRVQIAIVSGAGRAGY